MNTIEEIIHDDALYDDIFQTWGINAQLDMVVEESCEMMKELCHLKRNRILIDDFIGECADVFFMMIQMRQLNPELFDHTLKKKHDRIIKRLENSKKLKPLNEFSPGVDIVEKD